MNTVAKDILDAGGILTRADIAKVLESIGKPGKLRDEKSAAIRELCQAKSAGINSEGHHIADTLEDWPEF
jgi:hypothetical protein